MDLRPKSFDVLRYLVENTGRVVSRDELMSAIWPDVIVTEDSLTRCISEIRHALHDDAQHLVATIPKRGYRLAVPVTCGTALPAPASTDLAASLGTTEQAKLAAAQPRDASEIHRADWAFIAALQPLVVQLVATVPGRAVAILGLILVAGGFSLLLWPPHSPSLVHNVQPRMMAAPTIAVLPFAALNKESGLDGAAALSVEVRSELARAPKGFDLVIVAPSAQSGQTSMPPLRARYEVRGTTWIESGATRANVQLQETGTGRQIWSESFTADREEHSPINLLAARIGRSLAIHVRTAEVARLPPSTMDAGHFVLLGRTLLDSERDKGKTAQARSLFEKALLVDPQSIAALQGLARAMLNQVQNFWLPTEEHAAALEQTHLMIEQIIALDSRNVAGHYFRGSLLRTRGLVNDAIAAFEHALSLNPNYAFAHAEIGRAKIDAGRSDETIDHIRAAIRLSPTDPVIHMWYFWAGMAAVHLADNRAALEWLLKSRQANRKFEIVLQWLAVTYKRTGDESQAQTIMEDYLAKRTRFSVSAWRKNMKSASPVATLQRQAIEDVLRRLGVPEERRDIAHK